MLLRQALGEGASGATESPSSIADKDSRARGGKGTAWPRGSGSDRSPDIRPAPSVGGSLSSTPAQPRWGQTLSSQLGWGMRQSLHYARFCAKDTNPELVNQGLNPGANTSPCVTLTSIQTSTSSAAQGITALEGGFNRSRCAYSHPTKCARQVSVTIFLRRFCR